MTPSPEIGLIEPNPKAHFEASEPSHMHSFNGPRWIRHNEALFESVSRPFVYLHRSR